MDGANAFTLFDWKKERTDKIWFRSNTEEADCPSERTWRDWNAHVHLVITFSNHSSTSVSSKLNSYALLASTGRMVGGAGFFASSRSSEVALSCMRFLFTVRTLFQCHHFLGFWILSSQSNVWSCWTSWRGLERRPLPCLWYGWVSDTQDHGVWHFFWFSFGQPKQRWRSSHRHPCPIGERRFSLLLVRLRSRLWKLRLCTRMNISGLLMYEHFDVLFARSKSKLQ